MASSFSCFVAVLLASCLAVPTAGEQEQLLRRAAALSFGEGYTQLFGDSNLALHGKRVHITLDERTGLGSLLARPMPSFSL
jgi:xyloglucan:xyloglucosyl transferase